MPSTSYYQALKTAWTSTALPAGVIGTALTSTMNADQKLTAINSWMMSGPAVPMIVPTYAIYNVIVASEFGALGSTQQQWLRDILGMGTVDGSAGTAVRSRITSIFSATTQTFANLVALSTNYDSPRVPWLTQSTGGGLSALLTPSDLVAAGVI